MRILLVSLLTLFVAGFAAARGRSIDTPEAQKVLFRAGELTHAKHIPASKSLFSYIPPRCDFAKETAGMAKMTGYAAKQQQPVIIYSPNAELAARMITIAFATVRAGALRGVTIIAAVGEKNDGYIRPVIERTGASLFVQPLP